MGAGVYFSRLLFRVVEIHRICEATATPKGRCQPERDARKRAVRTIRGLEEYDNPLIDISGFFMFIRPILQR